MPTPPKSSASSPPSTKKSDVVSATHAQPQTTVKPNGELTASNQHRLNNRATTTPVRVMLVDRSRLLRRKLETCDWGRDVDLAHVSKIDDARALLDEMRPHVAFVHESFGDDGLDLVQDLTADDRQTLAVVITDEATMEGSLAAMRAGASDYLAKALDKPTFNDAVQGLISKLRVVGRRKQRVRRLRRACRKLDTARGQVMEQVDVLCSDLVVAYQELAAQMQQVVQTSEYAAVIRQELDLEQLLRKTLEYLLDKVGPTNAAIFLPCAEDEYSLGGYVNFDRSAGSPEVLLQHLADVVAPRVADRGHLLHITDNDALQQWIGKDYNYLVDCHVVAAPCFDGEDVMAAVMLFRDGAQPFDDAVGDTLDAIAPMLGDYLAKVVRVHHRMITPTAELDTDHEDGDGFDAEDGFDGEAPF